MSVGARAADLRPGAAPVRWSNVLGVLPFCAIGLFVGSLVSGQAAPAIVNLIYLPMAFLSGLWVPLQFLPKVAAATRAAVARASPGAAGARHAWARPAWARSRNHVAALAGVTVLFFRSRAPPQRTAASACSAHRARSGTGVPLRRASPSASSGSPSAWSSPASWAATRRRHGRHRGHVE